MQKRKTIILSSCVVAVMGLAMSGCLKSKLPEPTPAKTYISVMHLALTAPSLDIFFNDTKVSGNAFTPGGVSAAYNDVDQGNFTVRFKKVLSDSLVASVPLAQYDSLHFYTILIYNRQPNGPAEAFRIEDNFTNITPGKPYYRFFHTSPNVDAVDLYIDNVKVETSRTLADNAMQPALSGFREISSGSHSFQVKLAGTDSIIATRANSDLLTGNAYTLYLRKLNGAPNNNEFSLGFLQAAN